MPHGALPPRPSVVSAGRNDPCPCGSGRKFKRCCLAEVGAEPDGRAAGLHGRLFDELWTHARRVLGDARLQDAGERFGVEQGGEVEVAQLFAPWLCFHWVPEFERGELVPEGWEPGLTVAECYLQRHERRLSPAERAYVEAAVLEPLSSWSVEAVRGDRLHLRDVLRGVEAEVEEPDAARVLEPGDVILAAVVEHEGRAGFCGLGASPLPASAIPRLAAFGEALAEAGGGLVDDLLAEHSLELIALHRELARPGGRGPELVHLRFEVESAETAFEALRPLAEHASDDELSEAIRTSADGHVVEADLEWSEEGPDGRRRVVARLLLRGPQLDAVCDSQESAARVRAELARRLGAEELDARTIGADDLAGD
jgi:hypothetical protein